MFYHSRVYPTVKVRREKTPHTFAALVSPPIGFALPCRDRDAGNRIRKGQYSDTKSA